jgi:DeoR family transcriptional regulator of aga operon
VDKAFLAADGFDISRGVFTPNMEEAALSHIIIDNAKEVIVVADSGKFKRKSIFLFCPAEKINRVITDEKITKKQIAQFREQGTGVIIA